MLPAEILSLIASLLIRVTLIITRHTPNALFLGLSHLAAWATLKLKGKTYRVVSTNLDLCIANLTVQQKHQLMKNYFIRNAYLSKEAAEAWQADKAFIQAKFADVINQSLIDELQIKQTPTIVVVPHIGNWEFFWHWLQLNYQPISMYSPARFKPLDNIILKARRRFGGKPYATDPKGLINLMKALKKGGLMMILPDQAPVLGAGIYSPFFGHPAYTMTLLHKLTQKTGAKLIFGSCLNEKPGSTYRIQLTPANFPTNNLNLESFNENLNQQIEKMIKENPEQYLWGYKRFKRQPAGSELYEDERRRAQQQRS